MPLQLLVLIFLICVINYPSVAAYSPVTQIRIRNSAKFIAQTTPNSLGNERHHRISSIEGCRHSNNKRRAQLLKPESRNHVSSILNTSSTHHQDAATRRREFLKVSTIAIPTALSLLQPSSAKAISLPFSSGPSRRQLELCIVGVLRLRYWAQGVSSSIADMQRNAPPTGLTDSMKGPYLEARLGAKAALTGRLGGGSNPNVFNMASLQIKECLIDGLYWYDEYFYKNLKNESSERKAVLKKQRVALLSASEDIVESLAAVVEFDGLENLQDASPRSTLFLSMYNDSKANFIQRMLLERTVVYCDIFVNCYGGEERDVCEKYMRANYPNEMPKAKPIENLTETLAL